MYRPTNFTEKKKINRKMEQKSSHLDTIIYYIQGDHSRNVTVVTMISLEKYTNLFSFSSKY